MKNSARGITLSTGSGNESARDRWGSVRAATATELRRGREEAVARLRAEKRRGCGRRRRRPDAQPTEYYHRPPPKHGRRGGRGRDLTGSGKHPAPAAPVAILQRGTSLALEDRREKQAASAPNNRQNENGKCVGMKKKKKRVEQKLR
ncbi:hypothetical protein HPB48_019346 [Haemaphysalis longicornis]|uniref:Uncharacterized protein n=1 Tax=Haemaphysalis longicornis TaxID=44386 RepID=A0A9J6G574_HAELO|nr:hypothetical protein HPB48_019346 [Haemaphysalis longicornis]